MANVWETVEVRRWAGGLVRAESQPTRMRTSARETAPAFDADTEVLVTTGRMMFAAGAKAVYPGIGRFPEIIYDPKELETVADREMARGDVHLVASHLFGTVCAGGDRGRGVVGEGLEAHDHPGLFVMDASVFPTNLGVNPQHSIMGLVWRASERLANQSKGAAAA